MADANTRFGEALEAAMQERGLSIKDVADRTETTYEYIRKMLRGLSLPSPFMLKNLCQELGLNKSEMEKLLVADRIQMKYGKVPSLISGKNPELEGIEKVWPYLTDEHKAELTRLARDWAKRDKTLVAQA